MDELVTIASEALTFAGVSFLGSDVKGWTTLFCMSFQGHKLDGYFIHGSNYKYFFTFLTALVPRRIDETPFEPEYALSAEGRLATLRYAGPHMGGTC